MTLHVGAALDRFPGPKYQQALHFAELSFRAPRPRPATLRKLRRDTKGPLRIALVAPKDAMFDASGVMKVDAVATGLAWLRDAADALEAEVIVLPTGRELSPGARDRERLATYLAALGAKAGRTVVWHAHGLWEREEAAAFARKLGVVAAFDPLEDDAVPGPIGYARLAAIGARSRISSGMLAKVVAAMRAADYGTGYVAIDSPRSFKDARAAASLFVAAADAPAFESDDELSFDDEEE